MIDSLSGTEPWRPRVLWPGAGGFARVALVQSRASLLGADDVLLEVHVGSAAALELVELGALLAHSARGGAGARLVAQVRVEDGGRLIWVGQPLIVGAGARVSAEVEIALAGDAVVLRGESVVLGRAGEACGALVTRTRITCRDVPLVDETLDTSDRTILRSPVVAGSATMIGALTLAGRRDHSPPPGVLQAHGPATLWRQSGRTVETGRSLAMLAERWSRLRSQAAEGRSTPKAQCARTTAGSPDTRPMIR